MSTESDIAIARARAEIILARKVDAEVEDALRACVRDWNMDLADLSLESVLPGPLETRILNRGRTCCVVKGDLSPDARHYVVSRTMVPY